MLSNTGSKVLCVSVTPAMKLVSLDQNQPTLCSLPSVPYCPHQARQAFEHFKCCVPKPLSLGYDIAHCHVCWYEDSLLDGTCRQWPPRGDLLPHLALWPSSLLCPSTLPHVSRQEASLTYCMSPRHPLCPFSLSWPPSHLPAITQQHEM